VTFGGVAVGARVERAESRLIADATAEAIRRGAEGAFVTPLAGGVAAYARPGSPLNKVAGVGFAAALDERALAEVEAAYAERATPVRFELSTLGDPAIPARLTRRGYVLEGHEHVLGRPLPAGPAPERHDLQVLRSDDHERSLWIDTVLEGFAHPDEQGVPSSEAFPRDLIEATLGDLSGCSGLVHYLAWRRGSVAGGASVRLDEAVAIFCGAATLPPHRRRGVQTALLLARLDDAGRAGCDLAVVTTQPGSKSQENVQKEGFALLYARAVLVKAHEGAA
jgi:GNAT superfamily N-acetyltransferase